MSGDTPKRPRGRPPKLDRSEVVRAAMLAWWAEGPGAFSLNEICRHTGMSKSSLYREFGGEDGLMAAALDAYRTLAVLPLLALLEDEAEPADVLHRLIVFTSEQRPLPPGCFFTRLRVAPGSVGDATAALLAKVIDERLAAFERWFRGVQARGRLADGLSASEAARYLDAQLSLVMVRVGAGDGRDGVRRDAAMALGVVLAD